MCDYIRFNVENKCYTIVTPDSCLSLNDPNNGVINCYLGDDGVPSYEDICGFTCNAGYELTGSETRTCQRDGSWSGIDATCSKGINIVPVVLYIELCIYKESHAKHLWCKKGTVTSSKVKS